ncbi:hypothetical protein TCAL_11504, partial [Tigriopus californicus]|eukprot:TCALIF_11504-PA protein Name:"Protein of unknown function" AED:0.73 eAED:0.73 QI:38/0.33/0/0.75/0.33/0.25/4/0/777
MFTLMLIRDSHQKRMDHIIGRHQATRGFSDNVVARNIQGMHPTLVASLGPKSLSAQIESNSLQVDPDIESSEKQIILSRPKRAASFLGYVAMMLLVANTAMMVMSSMVEDVTRGAASSIPSLSQNEQEGNFNRVMSSIQRFRDRILGSSNENEPNESESSSEGALDEIYTYTSTTIRPYFATRLSQFDVATMTPRPTKAASINKMLEYLIEKKKAQGNTLNTDDRAILMKVISEQKRRLIGLDSEHAVMTANGGTDVHIGGDGMTFTAPQESLSGADSSPSSTFVRRMGLPAQISNYYTMGYTSDNVMDQDLYQGQMLPRDDPYEHISSPPMDSTFTDDDSLDQADIMYMNDDSDTLSLAPEGKSWTTETHDGLLHGFENLSQSILSGIKKYQQLEDRPSVTDPNGPKETVETSMALVEAAEATTEDIVQSSDSMNALPESEPNNSIDDEPSQKISNAVSMIATKRQAPTTSTVLRHLNTKTTIEMATTEVISSKPTTRKTTTMTTTTTTTTATTTTLANTSTFSPQIATTSTITASNHSPSMRLGYNTEKPYSLRGKKPLPNLKETDKSLPLQYIYPLKPSPVPQSWSWEDELRPLSLQAGDQYSEDSIPPVTVRSQIFIPTPREKGTTRPTKSSPNARPTTATPKSEPSTSTLKSYPSGSIFTRIIPSIDFSAIFDKSKSGRLEENEKTPDREATSSDDNLMEPRILTPDKTIGEEKEATVWQFNRGQGHKKNRATFNFTNITNMEAKDSSTRARIRAICNELHISNEQAHQVQK